MISLKKFASKYIGGKAPKYKLLEANKVPLTSDERALVMKRGATWHHGPGGAQSPAVFKSILHGKTWYVTNTHRAYNATNTLKGTINRYHRFIKGTA